MFLDLARSLLLFLLIAFGIGWLPAARFPFAPAEKIVAATALSLLGTFLIAWLIYVAALPAIAWWVLPALGASGLAVRWRELAETWRDADGRAVIIGQLIISIWCVGWLGTIASYSGGGWTSDWYEHWQRTSFFLEHRPLGEKFIGVYSLPARPPLANVVTGALLAVTRLDFAHYQLFSTLLASVAFLPAALLARRFGRGTGTITSCAVALMVSPLFIENATFAWTKLPAAFFALVALYFFLRAQEPGAPLAAALLSAASLAAGLLAHYSVGPYAVMLAAGWLWLGWRRIDSTDWLRATVGAILVAAVVLATWFAWSLQVYGARETFLSNSSVTASAAHQGTQLGKIAGNLRDTLVPHFLRPLDQSLIDQQSPWGRWRDWFFQSYQLNLLLACGSAAWLVILRELLRTGRRAAPRVRWFWIGFGAGVVLLGVATHGARDEWGLAHICLQAFVLLALAFLAARWSELGRGWRIAVVAGATLDFLGGIALQFGVQSYALDRWFAPGRPPEITLRSYTESAFMNLAAKIKHKLVFFSDALAVPPGWLAIGLVILLLVAVRRATREPSSRSAG
jgi:hypothetical protein